MVPRKVTWFSFLAALALAYGPSALTQGTPLFDRSGKKPVGPTNPLAPSSERSTEQKLAMAFGKECPEVNRAIRMEVRFKGLILAAEEISIAEKDGRVKFKALSVAVFSKDLPDAKFPEIKTIQCEEAYLTLDQRVSDLIQMVNRRILAVEFRGDRGVSLRHNRGTPEADDDLLVYVSSAPLFFAEKENKIWTNGAVELKDLMGNPEPTKIKALGMDVKLATEDPAIPTQSPGNGINGIEALVLRGGVEMYLYVDARFGLLAPTQALGNTRAQSQRAEEKLANPQEKSKVVICTQGPFRYDFAKDLATFDSGDANIPLIAPPQVLVVRKHLAGDSNGPLDNLVCNHLELKFRRKNQKGRTLASQTGMEIESALATARKGEEVILIMESDKIFATGNELLYIAPTARRGFQTILKGNPLQAAKDGLHIEKAQELRLLGPDEKGLSQRVFVKGPGRIEIFYRNDLSKLQVNWEDTLNWNKVRDGKLEMLTVDGPVAVLDKENNKEYSGRGGIIWLNLSPKKSSPILEKVDVSGE